jgi:hypothetical protein
LFVEEWDAAADWTTTPSVRRRRWKCIARCLDGCKSLG